VSGSWSSQTWTSPELVPYALAGALGVHERPNEPIDAALMAHLRDQRVLLILDTCEHLLPACRQLVASIVSEGERIRILCTSRERLDVSGEAVVVVAALDVPDDDEPADALKLLVDRAAAVAPDFALTEENSAAASEICRRLDGMPLVIELAAVRLASMSPDDLRERLDDRLRLLVTGGQTLRATVDWSDELLSDDERILWRRLSVFAGSFGLVAADDVCSGAGLEPARILDLIASLVRKSILTMGHGSRRGRYRLLETLRLYGAERLAEAGEDAELARRHAIWYGDHFSGGELPWSGTPIQGETFKTLDVEWSNVEAARDFLVRFEPETGLRLSADLWLYWLVRGRYRPGGGRIEAFLALAPAETATRAMALWAVGF
jgi:predicted ATPase